MDKIELSWVPNDSLEGVFDLKSRGIVLAYLELNDGSLARLTTIVKPMGNLATKQWSSNYHLVSILKKDAEARVKKFLILLLGAVEITINDDYLQSYIHDNT